MCQVKNTIASQPYDKLQVQKLTKHDGFEILSISLEKDAVFPEHTSPTDAQLVMLEGDIIFHIDEKSFQIKKHQNFGFPKETAHWVKSKEDSKFLIIR